MQRRNLQFQHTLKRSARRYFYLFQSWGTCALDLKQNNDVTLGQLKSVIIESTLVTKSFGTNVPQTYIHTNICVYLSIFIYIFIIYKNKSPYLYIYILLYINIYIQHIKISKGQTKSPCCLMLEYETHTIASISGSVQDMGSDMGSDIVVGACVTPIIS